MSAYSREYARMPTNIMPTDSCRSRQRIILSFHADRLREMRASGQYGYTTMASFI